MNKVHRKSKVTTISKKFKKLLASFSSRQKIVMLAFVAIALLSVIAAIASNMPFLSRIEQKNDTYLKIHVDNTDNGEITLECIIDDMETRQCQPMVVSGTYDANIDGVYIYTKDRTLIINDNNWMFEIDKSIANSNDVLQPAFIKLYLADYDNLDLYEYKLLVNFKINEDSISRLREKEKIEEEKRLEAERILAEQRKKEWEDSRPEREAREFKEKIRVACLNNSSFEFIANPLGLKDFRTKNQLDYTGITDPRHTGYGNLYLVRGTISWKTTVYGTAKSGIVSCIYDNDTGDLWVKEMPNGVNEDVMNELEADFIDMLASQKGYKEIKVTPTTDYCKDGTAAFGNRHAKGAANSCYGHGGWR